MYKRWSEDQNMNKALSGHFISLLPSEHVEVYQHILVTEPNCHFLDMFQYFKTMYSHFDKIKIEANQDEMCVP